jgi:hypothetical protein
MLQSFETSPQPSLLQHLSSPKLKSTTLLDRISRSSYSMTNQSKQQCKVNDEANGSEMLDEPSHTSKRALSPDAAVGTGKRQKSSEADFPWSI